jgi:hypothetical protein
MKKNIIYLFIFFVALRFQSTQLSAEEDSTYSSMNVIFVDEQGLPVDIDISDLQLEQAPEADELSTIYAECNYDLTSWYDWFWQKISFDQELYETIETIANEKFGIVLRLSGYYDLLPETGTYGKGEFNDKVRITFVNGILNLQKDILNSAKLISDTHGGTNVHYIFRPTQGFAWDLAKSSLVKCGYISQQAIDIAMTWRLLIEEMGGVGNGGKIIHYAHSIGAADTFTAKTLLRPEEVAMVSVVTFGSPVIFPNKDFESVINYASVRDGVPSLRVLSIFYAEENCIIFVGSYAGIPIIDHLLDNETYRSVLEILGQEFTETYLLNSSTADG